jgi:UDP-N-acetylmuramyl pentapeptide phosphotransferase/UDP-N-acetylglucosamine-1-phosphate transferase/ribonuclease BN (tRNA processing enzyme)
MLGYLAGTGIIVLLGLWDDRRGMKPLVKMFGQFAVSLVFIGSNFTLAELGLMFGSIYISLPIMVLWMVGLMNALNFLDNMDGIISGMAGILGLGFFAFALINTTQSNMEAMALMALISLSFAGSTFGFLPYNFNPARIFLGDAGSMFIGYFLSSMGILMARYAGNRYNDKFFYLLPVLLLSYAIFDISLVSYTRRRDGRHVMQGGKDHSTHRINNVLGSIKVTAAIIYTINVLIVLTAIIIFRSETASADHNHADVCRVLFGLWPQIGSGSDSGSGQSTETKNGVNMEAIVLGSGPGLPQEDRNLSSVLVRKGVQTVLADCGDGCIRRLMDHGIKADDLDAIFITHYHPDHVGGLFILLQMLYLQGRTKSLPVFLPERPSAFVEIMQLMYTFSQKFKFKLQILDMDQAELYFDWISAYPTDHLLGYSGIIKEHNLVNEMKSWALSFTGESGKLVYTSDLETTDCIADLLSNAHTAIVDAGHPEAEQILKLKYLNIQRIILTHGISKELEARQAELEKDLFEFAQEDVVYSV